MSKEKALQYLKTVKSNMFLTVEDSDAINYSFDLVINDTTEELKLAIFQMWESQKKFNKDDYWRTIKDELERILNKEIIFKSNTENFYKERDGLKRNTIRKIDETDPRFIALRKGYKKIKIVNKQTLESFEKNITDYTEFEGWAILSW
jgi:hypothetical protein